jgi:hypothetical protein
MRTLQIRASAKELSVFASAVFNKDIKGAPDKAVVEIPLLFIKQILQACQAL